MTTGPVFGYMTWLGYSLTLAAPTAAWFEWLSYFTGLAIERCEAGATPAILQVVDDGHVLVDGNDLRTFASADDLKAWLALTVSDVLVYRGNFTVFHAASFIVDDKAVLLAGPPWAGKSSWAFAAYQQGLDVLGDDQVRIDPATGLVYGLPRPLKRRLIDESDANALSSQAIRSQLDDEHIALEPRCAGSFATLERGYPVARIIHLERHTGTGVDSWAVEHFSALRRILDQIRCYVPDFFPEATACARRLAQLPNVVVSVGDGEIGRALAQVVSDASGLSTHEPYRADVLDAE